MSAQPLVGYASQYHPINNVHNDLKLMDEPKVKAPSKWETTENGQFKRTKNGNTLVYETINLIGMGYNGQIKKLGSKAQTIKTKALKTPIKDKQSLVSEYEIRRQLPDTEGLIRPFKCLIDDHIIMSVYEQDLGKKITKTMSSKEQMSALRQLSNGLAAMHQLNIVHADIFYANVLCRTERKKPGVRYDLADFGRARQFSDALDKRKDVEALGQLFHHILEKKTTRVYKNDEINLPTGFPAALADLVKTMKNTEIALTIDEVVKTLKSIPDPS